MHMFSHRFNRTGIRARFTPPDRPDPASALFPAIRNYNLYKERRHHRKCSEPACRNPLHDRHPIGKYIPCNTSSGNAWPPVNIGKQYTIRPVPVNIATGTGTAFTRIDDPLLSTLSDMKNLSSKKSSQLTQRIISDTLTCQPDIPGFDLP